MSRYVQRPENALKRANEFIDVGKKARALDTLQEVFRAKKWNYNWSESIIEPIMFKYLDLCVELKKSHIAKEGLFQYRNMFQLVNVGSLENVIRGYLKMAEERTEQAQQQSSQAIVDIDDLDNLATPESILMSAVCGEDAQDRSDRTILLPWVKFLWESYCQCLELLKVNSHCETLYHDIARMAFQFCLKYNRKMEFRKLCEKLRKHLEDICKVSSQTANVSISKPETQQLNLETRLHQLDSAIQMELWLEAYKAIEDIHGLMTLSKKTPLPKTMALYYQKLAMVFWKAGNQLFHAAALLKLFQLSRDMKKNVTAEEIQRMTTHVLIATLAIPLPSAHPEFDRFIETDKSPMEKAQRLAFLLGLQQSPSRALLLKELLRLNVFQLALPQFRNLYQLLEVEFDPLNLCNSVQKIIDEIEADPNSPYVQYVQALKDVTLVRLVRQISQVYQTIEFSRLLELAKFADYHYLERILVDCVRHNDMQITIDHRNNCVHFGTDLSESQREDHPDGPTLQSMPSEQIRSQLVNMSVVLHRAIATINPNRKKAERERLRTQMVHQYEENAEKEHQRILQRQKKIEDRKEYIERVNLEREEEELRMQEEQARQHKLAEQRRLEVENEERERKRHENELQMIKERNMKDKIEQIKQTATGQKLLKKMDEEEIRKLNAEEIAAREAEERLKERKAHDTNLKTQEKKVDYFERAKRLEEIPLIEKYLQERAVQDKEFWEKQEAARIEAAIAERKNAEACQERLKRMLPDREIYWQQLKNERGNQFAEKLKQFNVALEEERKRRLADRVVKRREERRQKWLKEKEEERRRVEEEIRKQKEEEERIERERRAEERRIEDEKNRLIAEKQRAKEEEVERKLAEERERLKEADRRERDTWRERRAGGAGGGGEAKQDDNWRKGPAPGGAADEPKKDAWQSSGRFGGRERDGAPRGGAREEGGASDKWRRAPEDQDKDGARDGPRRGGEIRRGGDDRGPIRRGVAGEDRDREDRGPIRRGPAAGAGGPDDRDRRRGEGAPGGGAPRRGGDDRGGFNRDRRDDRGPRPAGGDRDNTWRRGPAENRDDNRRAPAAREEGGAGGGARESSWRTAPRQQDAPKPREERPQREQRPPQENVPPRNTGPDEDGWTDVKHR
ncbi:eukaryotic translation initiation factor 3 subunit A [Anopheles ziemanni]|uniref:eukaryotic translation initiation factor 3 subunit A n=1 Tax=Anopheles coustani TaxID=139045 RepID=UPI00265902A8|nr:eukaryotic translation initiation factor 3 subunit A [Anopheles coustani]XP_058174146.1 eukaryotic translation initiation factor 3 subunit A [Anopheles ziemanni]